MGLCDFDVDPDEPLPIPFTVVADPELNARFPRQFPARVMLELQNGETLSESVDFPLGDPENPLSRERVEDKLRELAAYGGVERKQAEAVIDWVRTLRHRGA
jgi:2-methylcitrate dehydratase PrpD